MVVIVFSMVDVLADHGATRLISGSDAISLMLRENCYRSMFIKIDA